MKRGETATRKCPLVRRSLDSSRVARAPDFPSVTRLVNNQLVFNPINLHYFAHCLFLALKQTHRGLVFLR